MRKGGISGGEGGGGRLGAGMELSPALRWYSSFSTQLSPIAACSAQEQWCRAAGQEEPIRGQGPLHSVFLCLTEGFTATRYWERMFPNLAQRCFFLYFNFIKGGLKTKNVPQVSWQKAFACALRTRVTGNGVRAALRWLVPT